MKIFKLLVCFCLLGCDSLENDTPQSLQSHRLKDSSQQLTVVRVERTFIEELPKYICRPKHRVTTEYECEMHFEDEYAINAFRPDCAYYFFTRTARYDKPQVVTLIWSYKTTCSHKLPFLHSSNGVKRYPKYGDVFAEYRPINDTTLSVEYMFPEWIKKVNEIAKDSLFPQRLYLEKPGSS